MGSSLSVFALVGVMNAINMADGLDGLAGALIAELLGAPQYVMFYLYMTCLLAWGCTTEIACKKLRL